MFKEVIKDIVLECQKYGITVPDVPVLVMALLHDLVPDTNLLPITVLVDGETPICEWWAARQTDAVQEAFKRERNCHRDMNYQQMVQIVKMWNRTCYNSCVDFVQKVTQVTLTEAADFVLAQWA